ncbi:MAG: hypothetical protein AB2541_01895 [Candidatus Thiodiazotropha sp.]
MNEETPKTERTSSSKRLLSSPFSPEDFQTKKNKAGTGMSNPGSPMEAELELDLEPQEARDDDKSKSQEQTGHLTLTDTHLKRIGEHISPVIHHNCLAEIRSDIRELVREAVSEVIDQKLSSLKTENLRLVRENEELKERVVNLEKAVDESEQYSRRNNVRLTNIPEKDNEDTDQIVLKIAEAIGADLTIAEIDRSHRTGKPGRRHRDIIVKLSTYRVRSKLIKNKKSLKGSEFDGVYINEDLTKIRGELLYEARRCVRAKIFNGAWSSDGRILVKDKANKVRRISTKLQLENLCAEQLPSQ